MLAKELAEKATDIVRSYLEGKLAPVLTEIAGFKGLLDGKASRDEMQAALDSKIAEVKAAIPEAVKGDTGPQGEPGKDAPALEILGGIKPEGKSYPIGTYATFDGGLWKAVEATEGLKGWVCIVEGFKSFEIEQISDREHIATLFLSSGAIQQTKLFIPALIYKGVFDENSEYQKGDTVTFKGGMWHCNETTNTKPGDGKAWTLAVKRGQDAKGA